MKKYIAALALLMFASHSLADVVIHLQTKRSAATTQPTASESAVSVSAVPGHDFATTFQIGQRTVEVNGTLETTSNGQYRVKIQFTDQDQQGTSQRINTVVEPKANDSVEVSKNAGSGIDSFHPADGRAEQNVISAWFVTKCPNGAQGCSHGCNPWTHIAA